MGENQPESAAQVAGLVPLSLIRTETALSRFPIHRIAKRGNVNIEIKNHVAVLWEVSYNSKYGQPGPLGYKLDTIVINKKLEEVGKPVPKLIRLGSLRQIADELGTGQKNTNLVKAALLQNASAFITAKITYKRIDRTERSLEAAFTRYSVIFTGETLPDGRRADAVYLLLNDIYLEVLNEALARPLDYDYMRALPPAAQRFYEIVSYQIYAALLHKNPRARLAYSDYCTLSTQTRYTDWDHVKKQMYKVHLPHLQSGYLAKVEFETTTDPEGRPDWMMLYTPGPNAAREYQAFKGGGNPAVQRLSRMRSEEAHALPPAGEKPRRDRPRKEKPSPTITEPELDAETTGLVEELVRNELNRDRAVLYARKNPEECRRQLAFVSFLSEEDFTSGRGAYLNEAIPGKYGPPRRYKEVSRAEESRQRRQAETLAEDARRSHENARSAAIPAELGIWVNRMENEHPEAFSGFTARIERDLEVNLSRFKGERAREGFRRLYASDKKRWECFVAYFTDNPCPLPELRAWIGQHEKELGEFFR